MTPEVLIALISAVSAVLLALVPVLSALLFATLKKRGLEVTALEQTQAERIAQRAILAIEERARKHVQDGTSKPGPLQKFDDAMAIAVDEAKRLRVPTPTAQTLEAQLPIVRASYLPGPAELAAALGSEPTRYMSGPLPPPPPVPTEERRTVDLRPPSRKP